MWRLILFIPLFIFAESYFEAEYLAWFVKKNPIPVPLVTFASLDDSIPGAIGQPHTHVLLGNQRIGMGWMQGFKMIGGWNHCNFGIEASYFLLPKVQDQKSIQTSGQVGSPNLAAPVFDVTGVWGLNGVSGETIFILPGPLVEFPFFLGIFRLDLETRLQGAEIFGFYPFTKECRWSFCGLLGMRWLELKESLKFQANTDTVPNSPLTPNIAEYTDHFKTMNNFVAGSFGLIGQFNWHRLHFDAKILGSIGANLERLKIFGSATPGTGTVWFSTKDAGNISGGIFSEPSNIGTHHRSPFAFAFETKLESVFEINPYWALDVGYTFLWISKVLRPGNQIDRKINSTRSALGDASRKTTGIGPGPVTFPDQQSAPLPDGPIAPQVLFKQSSFWAQGLNAGITLSF